MTPRTKALLLVLIAVGWAVLGVANLVKGHSALGVLYVVLGAVSGLIAALSVQNLRRSR